MDAMLEEYDPMIKDILPHGKMYTLQIGNERFVLSGASLSSDAPSYFTNYFLNSANQDKVLFIDRSPSVFQMIYSHLQGYFLEINNADDFTQLFNDALYYNLPRLLNTLQNNDNYYAIVGGESIKFPKKLLSDKANIPNFFSVSNEALFSDLSSLLITKKWIRPPPQSAPNVNRDATLLKHLINLLQGVEIDITSEEHRKSLIKEAKYYRFSTLVQKLIRNKIIYNPFMKKEEIIIGHEYIDVKNIELEDPYNNCAITPNSTSNSQTSPCPPAITNSRLMYLRPSIDSYSRYLQIQFDKSEVLLKPIPGGLFEIFFENYSKILMFKIISKLGFLNDFDSQQQSLQKQLKLVVKDKFNLKIDNQDLAIPSKDLIYPVVILKCLLSFELFNDNEMGTKFFYVKIIKGEGVSSLEKFYELSDNYV